MSKSDDTSGSWCCRGMRLADTVFLTLPVALLQTWIGMRCSHPGCAPRQLFVHAHRVQVPLHLSTFVCWFLSATQGHDARDR